MNPQQLLNQYQFQDQVEKAETLRKLQVNRPSNGTVAWKYGICP